MEMTIKGYYMERRYISIGAQKEMIKTYVVDLYTLGNNCVVGCGLGLEVHYICVSWFPDKIENIHNFFFNF